ncbi:hypothetical protein L195_g025449 [Trifolium pratense]|uniref:Uncharacterized protein n=1 Tax=Trifolium pratense TaxID=57577 RepID=A0A2K3NGI6_TRIPR|nr:hypothetical protein L195_g025449 [Trifolium pratense]
MQDFIKNLARQVLDGVLETLGADLCWLGAYGLKFAMLVWMLWNNRNNFAWNQSKETGQQLGVKAQWLWNEWNTVQEMWDFIKNLARQVLDGVLETLGADLCWLGA